MKQYLAMAFLASLPVSAGVTYTVTDIGVLPGGSESLAGGLSSNGYVSGTGDTFDPNGFGSVTHAFVWEDGTLYDVGALLNNNGLPGSGPDYNSNGASVNSNGTVTGRAMANFGQSGALYGNPNIAGIIPNLAEGFSINDSGQVVGDQYLYDPMTGQVTDLNQLTNGQVFWATAINDSSQITGSANGPNYTTQAYILSGNNLTLLGTLPGGTYARGNAISESGLVTGVSDDASGINHAFYTDSSGAMHEITGGAIGNGINSAGDVVGIGDAYSAFLYADGVLSNLNTLLATPGYTLTSALAINDNGQILAQGTTPTDGYDALLLTPLVSAAPEPAGLGLLAFGSLFAFLVSKRRT